jgi:hypothetical protein
MSNYTTAFAIRYRIGSLQEQTEVAVITAATQIQNEDPGVPDHANRKLWADWAIGASTEAKQAFMWPVANNPSIIAAVQTDPSGGSVPDSDVQFVVNSNVETVINDWIANRPVTP